MSNHSSSDADPLVPIADEFMEALRLDQAGTCIMVELGNGKRLFFDFGSGCMRNIIANQVPVPEINDIFITHLHVDHYADLPYLWAFAPFAARFKPLRVIGPSGRKPELGKPREAAGPPLLK